MKNSLLVFFTHPDLIDEFIGDFDGLITSWKKDFPFAAWTGDSWICSTDNEGILVIPYNILLINDDSNRYEERAKMVAESANSHGYNEIYLIYHNNPKLSIIKEYEKLLNAKSIESHHRKEDNSAYYQLFNYFLKEDNYNTISHEDFIFKIINGTLPTQINLYNLALVLRNLIDHLHTGDSLDGDTIINKIKESRSKAIDIQVITSDITNPLSYILNWDGLKDFQQWAREEDCTLIELEKKVHKLLKEELTKEKMS